MRFGGHQTFNLRDNWLYKGLHLLSEHGDIFSNEERSMEVLGVGKNMVVSINHWLQAVEVVENTDDRGLVVSDFGQSILSHDPYFDRIGTSWLLHYRLATNESIAAAWFWFFNKFGVSEFTSDSAAQYLERWVNASGRKVNSNTLTRDVQALLKTYLAPEYGTRETPEDNIVSPLSQLGLIVKTASGFKMVPQTVDSVPLPIAAICLIEFWNRSNIGQKEFRFEELIQRDGSPGKVFNMSNNQVLELVDRLVERYPKKFESKRSGGFFTVSIKSFSTKDLMAEYYEVDGE